MKCKRISRGTSSVLTSEVAASRTFSQTGNVKKIKGTNKIIFRKVKVEFQLNAQMLLSDQNRHERP
jgi:hypothetical protein